MEIKEITAKSILVKSKLPDTDYVVNPYTGCMFGCAYCYASFMSRFVHKKIQDWGTYVYVKSNACSLFRKELVKIQKKTIVPSILLSSVTDPYQPIEKKYKLVRNMLKILATENYLGRISILSKSPLVLRDLEIVKKIKNIEIGLTITSSEDSMSRFLEVRAPSVSSRYDTLKKLNQAGIRTYAFLGPLLPHYMIDLPALEKLFQKLQETGTTEIYVEYMNISRYIEGRLQSYIKKENKEIQKLYLAYKTKRFRQTFATMLDKLTDRYGLTNRLQHIISHRDF